MITTALIVLFVAKSLLIDLIALYFMRDHIDLVNKYNGLVKAIEKDLILINSEMDIFDIRLDTIEENLEINPTDDQ